MNNKQAYEILDQVCRIYKGTRDEHIQLQQALDVVKKILSNEDLPEKKE